MNSIGLNDLPWTKARTPVALAFSSQRPPRFRSHQSLSVKPPSGASQYTSQNTCSPVRCPPRASKDSWLGNEFRHNALRNIFISFEQRSGRLVLSLMKFLPNDMEARYTDMHTRMICRSILHAMSKKLPPGSKCFFDRGRNDQRTPNANIPLRHPPPFPLLPRTALVKFPLTLTLSTLSAENFPSICAAFQQGSAEDQTQITEQVKPMSSMKKSTATRREAHEGGAHPLS